ncbi:N-6 DNA methylase [Bacillus licheniformis]|nr:N-6 DNA methylase [Bacillus licheniformis]
MATIYPWCTFRGASEGKIRKQIIDMNLLDAVIGLPEGLFYGTGIPACIMIFRKTAPVMMSYLLTHLEKEITKRKNQIN